MEEGRKGGREEGRKGGREEGMSHKYQYFIYVLLTFVQFEAFASDIETAVLNAIEKKTCLMVNSHNNDICINPVIREEVDGSTLL